MSPRGNGGGGNSKLFTNRFQNSSDIDNNPASILAHNIYKSQRINSLAKHLQPLIRSSGAGPLINKDQLHVMSEDESRDLQPVLSTGAKTRNTQGT